MALWRVVFSNPTYVVYFLITLYHCVIPSPPCLSFPLPLPFSLLFSPSPSSTFLLPSIIQSLPLSSLIFFVSLCPRTFPLIHPPSTLLPTSTHIPSVPSSLPSPVNTFLVPVYSLYLHPSLPRPSFLVHPSSFHPWFHPSFIMLIATTPTQL